MEKKGAEPLNPRRHGEHINWLRGVLVGVSDVLTKAFLEVSNAHHVARVDMRFGESSPTSLDIVITLSSGLSCFPQQVFSEGNLDLLALLIFVTLTRKAVELGQAPLLILDDVFQSVDSSIRRGVVEYLLRHCKDWQLIFTVHDRLWLEQLRELLRRFGHAHVEHEIHGWTFAGGPKTRARDPKTQIEQVISRATVGTDPQQICADAGWALEAICDALSVSIPTSIVRRAGDRYTLGDLWPGVSKALRRSSSVLSVVQRLDGLISLRNISGAHYNEWAMSLPLSDAESLASAVAELYREARCVKCGEWVADEKVLGCSCGGVRLRSP